MLLRATHHLGWVLLGLVRVHWPLATGHRPQLAEQPFLKQILLDAQLPQQGGCTFGLVYTHI